MENKVTFKNNKGLDLAGIINIPDNQGKTPFVMICHGLYSSKNGNTYTKLADLLSQNNIASFRFDFIGHGESSGDTSHLSLSQSVSDLKEAFNVISNYNIIDSSRIGLFGRSFGGNVALRYASQTKSLKLLCLNAPAIDWNEIFKNRYSEDKLLEWEKQGYIYEMFRGEKHKLDYSFYLDSIGTNIYEICKTISSDILIIHGNADKTVPCQQSVRLKNKIGRNANLIEVEGADHEFNPNKQLESIKHSADFFKANL